MLIAVTSMEKSLDTPVARRFGWSEYVFVADTESRVVKIIDTLWARAPAPPRCSPAWA